MRTGSAAAGPEKLSPFLNVADQVPVSAVGVASLSASCFVPSPEMDRSESSIHLTSRQLVVLLGTYRTCSNLA